MDATALRRGERVASEVSLVSSRVASTVMYHGTSPWHPATFEETPVLTISLEPLYSFLALRTGVDILVPFSWKTIDPTSARE